MDEHKRMACLVSFDDNNIYFHGSAEACKLTYKTFKESNVAKQFTIENPLK